MCLHLSHNEEHQSLVRRSFDTVGMVGNHGCSTTVSVSVPVCASTTLRKALSAYDVRLGVLAYMCSVKRGVAASDTENLGGGLCGDGGVSMSIADLRSLLQLYRSGDEFYDVQHPRAHAI